MLRCQQAEGSLSIQARLPTTEVLIFTMHESETVLEELVRAGARGYLLKSDARRDLMAAIESLAVHKPYFTVRLTEELLKSVLTESNRKTLTDRERGVIQLVAEGHSNKVVARFLNISLKTVESHRAAVMRKLDLSSSADLVRYAIRNRIVEA
jgi:DNA-binding NarL/FixJ family response regulator